jgi:hypothetical protein
VIDEAELRQMSQHERRELARLLAAMERFDPLTERVNVRRRRLGLLLTTGCCVFLAGWIAVLVLTLPRHYEAGHWRAAWVGFDIALLVLFASIAWASWRQRQVIIVFLIVTGTLLCCDAWFDIMLDLGTPDIWMSVASAVLAELPLAFLLFAGARRLLRLSVRLVMELQGVEAPVPTLRRTPLFGIGIAETLPRTFREEAPRARS